MRDLIVAKVLRPVFCVPHRAVRREQFFIPKGEVVLAVRAVQLPKDSPVNWWVHPLPGSEERDWHEYAKKDYGVGAEEDDLEVLIDVGNELHKLGVKVYFRDRRCKEEGA